MSLPDELASVFTDIFKLSLTQSVIPTCFKQNTKGTYTALHNALSHLDKRNTKVTYLNDYRHVASVVMKCYERLVMAHINTIIPDTLDPLQFAYLPNRSTDDTICIVLHTALTHLDKRNTYVRRLFIDYISAFNTIVPSMLITKASTLGRNISLGNWILDFQSGCPQVVRVGNNIRHAHP